MLSFTKKILISTIQSILIEKNNTQIEKTGVALSEKIAARFGRSLAIRMVDAGSCNGCELEIQAMNNPYYNIERFGIHFVASPRHADILLVTGPVTQNMKTALIKTYEATPNPKRVIAVGDCAGCGGVFKHSQVIVGAVSHVIPVDVIIKGCPPTPLDIINGIWAAIEIGN